MIFAVIGLIAVILAVGLGAFLAGHYVGKREA